MGRSEHDAYHPVKSLRKPVGGESSVATSLEDIIRGAVAPECTRAEEYPAMEL